MLSRLLLVVALSALCATAFARIEARRDDRFSTQGLELLAGRYGTPYPSVTSTAAARPQQQQRASTTRLLAATHLSSARSISLSVLCPFLVSAASLSSSLRSDRSAATPA